MQDREHEEWLADEIARKAAKKNAKTPARPLKKGDDSKKNGPDDSDTSNLRSWVID